VAENVAMTMGRPVIAFPQQDHIAHLEAHLGYMLNPVLGANRLIAPQFLPGVLNHIKEHMALWYAQQVYELSNQATGMDMGDAVRENKSVADKQSFDRMLAQASNTVSQRAAEAFGDMPPVIEQAVQMLQSMSPQAPQDPAVQAAMAETERRAAADQAKAQYDAQRLQIEQQDNQVDAQMQQAKLEAEMQADQMQQQAEDQRSAMEMQARVAMNDADNQTAMLLAQMGGDEPAVNPNPNPQP
jgi:flagellar biosynthesis GTPase FlhF